MTLTKLFDLVQKDVLESRPTVSSERNLDNFDYLFVHSLVKHLRTDLNYHLPFSEYLNKYLSD